MQMQEISAVGSGIYAFIKIANFNVKLPHILILILPSPPSLDPIPIWGGVHNGPPYR